MKAKFSTAFETTYKKATNPIVVLEVLKERPMYGYEIATIINEKGKGSYVISLMYPILYKLLDQGYVAEDHTVVVDNRARSYYKVTEAGLKYLEETKAEYKRMDSIFRNLMKKINEK
ncbi:MAG: PadR family transcriptional regulator [Lachnospiraceae bacterium]|nr:PadR family transcriptional regulator [Lachnospiraceae bacterium]